MIYKPAVFDIRSQFHQRQLSAISLFTMEPIIPGELCPGCDATEYLNIQRFYKNDTAAIQFLRNHGCLPSSIKCPKCNTELRYYDTSRMWRCNTNRLIPGTRTRKKCGYKISDNHGTFLEKVKFSPWKVVLFANSWLRKWYNLNIIKINLGATNHTITDWRSFCSEVTEYWLENNIEAIGGPGMIIEIDETVIVKRKNNKGRILKEIWIFGGIERTTGKCFVVELIEGFNLQGLTRDERLKRLPRDKATLIPIIQQYIKPGSTIYSDGWSAYEGLTDVGYKHGVVIHKENFLNPDDKGIHTQKIERLWRDLKEWVKRSGMRARFLKQYISRWLFLRGRSHERCLHDFLVEVSKLYPHKLT